MKAWLLGLAPRERVIVVVGACLAIVIVAYGFVWRPLAGGADDAGESVAQKRALVADLQRAASLSPDSGGTAAGAATQSLVVLVDRTAGAGGLAASITATRPDGPDAINVSFQNAPFDAIVEWLLMLEQTHGVSVENASFNEARERGLVSGQMLLRRL